MSECYRIGMPPLCDTFELPAREHLLSLRRGDFVKLIVTDGHHVERMWAQISDIHSPWDWEGVLDNNPVHLSMDWGDTLHFHPLAIIDFKRLRDVSESIVRAQLLPEYR
jgi:hypothetical protein